MNRASSFLYQGWWEKESLMRTSRLTHASILFLLGGLLVLSGCKIGWVKGSGVKVSSTRAVAKFSSIELKSSADVVIEVGTPQSVVVETDDNLIALVTTMVSGDTLEIDATGSYSTRLGVKVTITVEKMESVNVMGSGDITVSGVRGPSFEALVHGSGDISVKGMTGTAFHAQVKGSGDITAEGVVDEVEVEVSGSGDIQLEKLSCDTADAMINGSGGIVVKVSKELKAQVSGSGDIVYLGAPIVTKTVSGSGDVRAK